MVRDCKRAYREHKKLFGSSSIDEIYVSVNGSSLSRSYNSSSYWKNEDQVCFQIIRKVIPKIVKDEIDLVRDRNISSGNMVVIGAIQNLEFFKINTNYNLDNFMEQCLAVYNRYRDSFSAANIDEIYISVNGRSQARLYNSSSYWSSSTAVCSQMIRHVGANR